MHLGQATNNINISDGPLEVICMDGYFLLNPTTHTPTHMHIAIDLLGNVTFGITPL